MKRLVTTALLFGVTAFAVSTFASAAQARGFGGFGGGGGGNFGGGSHGVRSSMGSISMGPSNFQPQMMQNHSFQPRFNQYSGSQLKFTNPGLTTRSLGTFTQPSLDKFSNTQQLYRRSLASSHQNGNFRLQKNFNLPKNTSVFKQPAKLRSQAVLQNLSLNKSLKLESKGFKNFNGPKFADLSSKLGIGVKHINVNPGKFGLGKGKKIDPGFSKGYFCGIGGCFPKCHPHCWPYPCGNYCWPYPYWCSTSYYCPGVIVSYPQVYVAAKPIPTVASAPPADVDLKMVDIQLVQEGDAATGRGPKYRIIVGNKGTAAAEDFEVGIVVNRGNGDPIIATEQIEGMEANSVRPVDIELPASVLSLKLADGSLAGDNLVVVIDGRRAVAETDEKNNAVKLARSEIKGVSMKIEAPADAKLTVGSNVTLSGTGLGAAAGKAFVAVNGVALEAPVSGWNTTAAKITLPAMLLAGDSVAAKLTLVRPDGVSAEPISVTLVPTQKN